MRSFGVLTLGLMLLPEMLGCGADDGAGLTPDSAGSGAAGAGGAAASAGAGGSPSAGAGAGSADCDVTGVWLAQQITVSVALNAAQYANTYFYLEMAQDGTAFEVSKSFNCGTIVQGTATVTLSDATIRALMSPNSQVGRTGTMQKNAVGNCEFAFERFWSVRGVLESDFLPLARNADETIASLEARLPLPTPTTNTGAAMDWDQDGFPGTASNVAGPINGTRHSLQRDWNEWFTDASYTITPAMEWSDDLVAAVASDSQESVMAFEPSDNPLLAQIAPSDVMNENNRVKLRYLGETGSDPRAMAMAISATDPSADPEGTLESCKAMFAAMPIEQARP